MSVHFKPGIAFLGALLFAVPVLAQEGGAEDEAPLVGPRDPMLPKETPPAIANLDFSTPVETLSDALERAYWANPELLAERATTRSVSYRLPQARALYGPSIDYRLTYGYQRDNLELPNSSWLERSGWSSTAAAILSQPVFTFGRLAANERSAKAEGEFQDQTLRLTEQRVLYGAVSAYIGVLRDRNGVTIARDNLQLLERELADTRSRFDVRESTAADLEQVATREALARSQLTEAEDQLRAAEAQFLSSTGSPAGELSAPNPLRMPVDSLEAAQDYAQDNNPLLAAAAARERVSHAARDAALAAGMPRVDLQGRAEVSSQSPYSNNPRQTSILGQLVVSGPLWDNGVLHARFKEAQAANDADWRLIDQSGRELRAEISSAWSSHLALRKSAAELAVAVDAAQKAYDGAVEQQRAGFRTTLDVLILARDLLSVKSSYNTTVASGYLAEARLLYALGALEHDYLLPDTPRSDFADHYRRLEWQFDIFRFSALLHGIDALGYAYDRTRPTRDPSMIDLRSGAHSTASEDGESSQAQP